MARRGRVLLVILVLMPIMIVTLLLGVAVLRASLLEPALNHVFQGSADLMDEKDLMKRALRLSGAIQIPTISYEPDKQEFDEFPKLHRYLETNYPLVHSSSFISREIINKYSLLYTVKGSSSGNGTLPYLLASHLDVVPAEPDKWDVPPFSGKIVDNAYIYGRGTMDDKGGVLAILEALEYILEKGERPKRTFYLAFGHDEEVLGIRGAKEIAKVLRSRGINQLDFLVDEGFPVTKGFIPGTDKQIAMFGVSEKGYVTLDLSVTGTAGHSSYPPLESAIGILAKAVSTLEQNPLPSMFGTGPEAETFADLAPHSSFLYRVIYGNLWLFSGLMSRILVKNPITNALARTTTAIAIFSGGIKENVVPPNAKAAINFRIHSSQSIAEVIELVRETINDPRVIITKRGNSREAHPISPTGPYDIPFLLIGTSMKQVYPGVVVTKGLLIGNTDCNWYLDFTRHIFRLYAFLVLLEDTKRIHGDNERISLRNYQNVMNFYYRLIRNADLMMDVVPQVREPHGSEL